MKIGTKIKEYRTEKGLTQKDLAALLNVTYQAVSRWENDDVEPSFDTLVKLCEIFGCTMDELFGIEKPANAPAEEVAAEKDGKEEAHAEEPAPVPAPAPTPVIPKPVLCLCEQCNAPIYEKEDVRRYEETVGESGKITHVLCPSCNEKRERALAAAKLAARREEGEKNKKKRTHAYVWSSLVAAVLIAVSVVFAARGKMPIFGVLFASGVLSFTFVSCMILDNNFILDVWMEIASWGFVKMPGVIMEFSLGGLFLGFALKILLWLLGFLLAFAAVAFATAVGMILSPFVYPYALRKNYREVKEALAA